MYLNLLDIVNDEEERICVKEERLIELKVPLREYYYINNLPKDILSKLEGLKIKNEMLTEKYQINESIKNEIEFLNLKKKEAENLMSKNQVKRIPIIEDNKLIGMLTLGDLAANNNIDDTRVGDTLNNICSCNKKNAQ